jgi:hypothetical protein
MSSSHITQQVQGLATATSPGLVGTGTQTFAGKKTLDGGALIKGDTSGAAIAAGYVGEFKESASITGYTGAANTWVNASNSLTLEAGIWKIDYHAMMETAYISQSGVCSVRIYNSTDAVEISNSRSASIINGTISTYQHVANCVVVNLTSTKVFYLQIACSVVSTLAKAQLVRSLTGGITGDQDTGKILAIRVA